MPAPLLPLPGITRNGAVRVAALLGLLASPSLPDSLPSTPQPPLSGAAVAAADTVRPSTANAPRASRKIPDGVPDSTWRWPERAGTGTCGGGGVETVGQCWRGDADWIPVETGFPGLRAGGLDPRSLEPARFVPLFQPGLAQSPFGTGGHNPVERYSAPAGGGLRLEEWAPVQPLDTPVSDLHWMRGALLLNQFEVRLRRMAGNRAYIGFDFGSESGQRQPYDYAFQVHQPYIGAGRDSLSLVIADTSHQITTRHLRARLGFWLDSRTVVEGWADWLDNGSSLANPGNPARNDSVQRLYSADFGTSTYGATGARVFDAGVLRATASRTAWERALAPHGDARYREGAAGMRTGLAAEWTHALNGHPRAVLESEWTAQDGALWVSGAYGVTRVGVTDSTPGTDSAWARAASDGAGGHRQTFRVDARPGWGDGPLSVATNLRADATRRTRPDRVVEHLGGGDVDARMQLPFGFHVDGLAGWNREGAPEERLFRWQPALGYHPNPDLTPRTHVRIGGGGGWSSRHLGVGATWEHHTFRDTWLPRILPEPNVCFVLPDPAAYPGETAACSGFENLADSLALAHVNYDRETRELLHVTGHAALGNWRLDLRHTALLAGVVRDPRLGFTGVNWQLPEYVFAGRLLWKRRVLKGRLGLQTQWDWEWFSERRVFAADMDGTSRVVPLDEYLVLDFTTRMEIRTFLLYFRAMNLYHDRYATEPGVHPPGDNDRFGVDWRLRN